LVAHVEDTAPNTRYKPLLQLIHWVIALLVTCQVAMASVLTQLRSLQYGQYVLSVHRQVGLAILVICVARIFVLMRYKAPAASVALPRWQTLAARVVHAAFYAVLIVQPIVGLCVAWARGDTITALGVIPLPPPFDFSDSAREQLMSVHILTAAILVGLVLIHAGAVIFNHWKRRVPVLERMLPAGPANALVNRVSVRTQLLGALGIVIAVALATGINAVVKYRGLATMTTNYQETDQAAATETRLAQVAWKEIVGIGSAGLASAGADRLRSIAEAAHTHLDSAVQAVSDPTARAAINGVSALVEPLSSGKQPFTASAIADVDTHLQDLIDTQAANAQQSAGDIQERASQGHDLIVVTVAPMVLLALILALLLARSMLSSINRMRALVRSIEANEGSQNIEVRGHGEFADLMRDMVAMRDAVRRRMQREADERIALEVSHREQLEGKVAERTAELSRKTKDINAMLHNMNLGVSTVVRGNLIHPEYSSYLRTIFSIDDLAGKELIPTMFGQSSLGVDAKDQISTALGAILGEDPMMFDMNSHLLAREMRMTGSNGAQKILQMDWNPILNDEGAVEKVLLIIQDITHLRELEASSAQQRDELLILSKITKTSVGRFNDFVESAGRFMAENRRLLSESGTPEPGTLSALFRNMHTIKGNARTLGFTHITDAAHSAEQTYDRLRKESEAEWNVETMLSELDAVAAALARYVEVNDNTLGRKGRASDLFTTRGAFVGNDQLAELRSMVAIVTRAHPGTDTARLQNAINRIDLVALSRLLAGVVDSLPSLASELHKPTPAVEIQTGNVSCNPRFAEALKSSFMHMLRNSLDHGIEAPADRLSANKPAQGKIRIACDQQGDTVELRISDDGRGLALHKLYEKGVATGLFRVDERPTRATVADTIFRSGVSTSAQVTEISGRGVGMDAVRTFLKEQGATVSIKLSEPNGRELGFAPFEFAIVLPPTALSHTQAEPFSELTSDALEEHARQQSRSAAAM
jgi:cytochrome b561/HPt (histidine-containing phosphotransfer) domain-containing protein